jgi:adenylosuccinate synthase
VLDSLKEIKICTSYKYKGKIFRSFPADAEVLEKAACVYESWPGWQRGIMDIKDYDKLPVNARRYLERLQDILKTRIAIVSVGSKREETIFT